MKKKHNIVLMGIGTAFLFNNGLMCAYIANSEIFSGHILIVVMAQLLINICIAVVTVMTARSVGR